jgi:hypothetical protein
MDLFHTTPLEYVFFALYVVCFCALNAISFLISLFYRKNFQRTSPRWGFLASIALALLFLGLLLAGRNGPPAIEMAARLCLLGSIAGSVFSATSLFFLMRRVRK